MAGADVPGGRSSRSGRTGRVRPGRAYRYPMVMQHKKISYIESTISLVVSTSRTYRAYQIRAYRVAAPGQISRTGHTGRITHDRSHRAPYFWRQHPGCADRDRRTELVPRAWPEQTYRVAGAVDPDVPGASDRAGRTDILW